MTCVPENGICSDTIIEKIQNVIILLNKAQGFHRAVPIDACFMCKKSERSIKIAYFTAVHKAKTMRVITSLGMTALASKIGQCMTSNNCTCEQAYFWQPNVPFICMVYNNKDENG